jgi:hypothetical protein
MLASFREIASSFHIHIIGAESRSNVLTGFPGHSNSTGLHQTLLSIM